MVFPMPMGISRRQWPLASRKWWREDIGKRREGSGKRREGIEKRRTRRWLVKGEERQ